MRSLRRVPTLLGVVCALASLVGVALGRVPFTPIPPTVPRPSGDHVPRSAHVLKVSWGSSADHSTVVSNASKIRRIARILDELPVEGPASCSQEDFGPPTVTFIFRRVADGPVLAKASGLDKPKFLVAFCAPTRFSVQGHARILLEGTGYLIKKAEKILGRKLN